MTASFGDPGGTGYEVYDGPLGNAVFVRNDGHLIGIAADVRHAMRMVGSNVAARRRAQRMQPVFHLAA